jgi:hypothetical protein
MTPRKTPKGFAAPTGKKMSPDNPKLGTKTVRCGDKEVVVYDLKPELREALARCIKYGPRLNGDTKSHVKEGDVVVCAFGPCSVPLPPERLPFGNMCCRCIMTSEYHNGFRKQVHHPKLVLELVAGRGREGSPPHGENYGFRTR